MTVLDPKCDELKFEIQDEVAPRPKIRVIGVGGAGSNAVAHIMNSGLESIECCVVDSDLQVLRASPVPGKLAIGLKLTGGRGAGADPQIGKQAALEDTERITELVLGADMVFVIAGLGCGTATGAAPVIASLAREMDALTVGMVTRPFGFEGPVCAHNAERGLAELREAVDALLTIPNDRLLTLTKRGTSLPDAFRMAHEIMRQAVAEIVEIITTPGLSNRNFSDIRAVMRGTGPAIMGTATARGEEAAVEAARQAINSPLVESATIAGARNILVHVTGSSRLGLHEVSEACTLVREAARAEDAHVRLGVVINESMADAVKVTVIATGFPPPQAADSLAALGTAAWKPAVLPPPASEAFPTPQTSISPVAEFDSSPQPFGSDEPEADADDFTDLEDLETPAFLKRRRLLP